jgi:hypothetical protein
VFVANFFSHKPTKKLAFQWCQYVILQFLSMHLQFEPTVEHKPKSDKGSFTTDLHVHLGEASITLAYVIVSLIVGAVFNYKTLFSQN